MNKILRMIINLIIAFLSCSNFSYAWGPLSVGNIHTAHTDITAYAVGQSVLNTNHDAYLRQLGLTEGTRTLLKWDVKRDGKVDGNVEKTIIQWLSDVGAPLEDGYCRELNHFLNPITNGGGMLGKSAPFWAQSSSSQRAWIVPKMVCKTLEIYDFDDGSGLTDWSWPKTREYFYSALTSEADATRQANFAKMFRGLGQQVHLLQDMSVPAHVRMDSHPFDEGLEEWAGHNIWDEQQLRFYAPEENIVMPTMPLMNTINNLNPVARLFDTDYYHDLTTPVSMFATYVGLAEWTSANFYSDDTINIAYTGQYSSFPFPNEGDTNLQSFLAETMLLETINAEDDVPDTGYYIKKMGTTGEEIGHFARAGYMTREIDRITGIEGKRHLTFLLDDNCYSDYAQKLLPRAVGYSAGLLDYFFRGDITLEPTDNANEYTIKNNSTDETMTGELAFYYDDEQGKRVKAIVNGSDDAIPDFTLGPGESSAPLTITPQASSTPKEKDHYIIAFKGTIGNETAVTDSNGKIISGAVAGRVKRWFREEWDSTIQGNHTWLWTGGYDHLPVAAAQNTIADGKLTMVNTLYPYDPPTPYPTDLWYILPKNGVFIQEAYENPWPDERHYCTIDCSKYPADCQRYPDYYCKNYDFGIEFPRPITRNTTLHIKIDEMSISHPIPFLAKCSPTSQYSQHAYQGIQFEFDNGYSLILTIPDQIPPGGGNGKERYHLVPDEGEIYVTNFFSDFAIPPQEGGEGVIFEEPVNLLGIHIIQDYFSLCDYPTVTYEQKIVVDYIRLED